MENMLVWRRNIDVGNTGSGLVLITEHICKYLQFRPHELRML